MFAKAWTYITEKFTRKEKQQPTVLLPFARPQPLPSRPSLAFSLPQQPNKQETPEFRVVVTGESEWVVSEEEGLAQEVIDQVRELEEQLKCMSIHERRLQELNQTATKLEEQRRPISPARNRQLQRHSNEFRQEYEADIVQFRQCKYSKELSDFPLIPYESFQRIQQFWRDKKRATVQIKRLSLKNVQKLTLKAMGGVDHGEWLNDDIINISIQLMEKQLPCDGTKLLNSFFATTILPKAENMIAKYVKNKGLDKTMALLMPINDKNHWYFARFDPQTLTLTVYDSLRKPSNIYLNNPIFKNALKFARSLYGSDLSLLVSEDYPQQGNGYDCGVFMLMGIRDALRQRQWSFRQGDMRFKRVQLACEVYDECLMLGG